VGVCRHGFCHCPAGRFGLDCSRTEAYAPRDHRPARGDLRIYVYDLPTSLALAETLDYGTRSPNSENFQVILVDITRHSLVLICSSMLLEVLLAPQRRVEHKATVCTIVQLVSSCTCCLMSVRADMQTFNPIYKAYELFLRNLLRDDSVRTQDPYEANLFYVPALTCASSSDAHFVMLLHFTVEKLQQERASPNLQADSWHVWAICLLQCPQH